MNYFAHALPYLDRPGFAVGTAVPDLLSVADRQSRVNSRLLQAYCETHTGDLRDYGLGVAQHLNDDQWFHRTVSFTKVTAELTIMFRDLLHGSDGFRCGFLGHIATELLLDACLIERYPHQLHRYYSIMASTDGLALQQAVNQMVKRPAIHLAQFLPLFVSERFLECYSNDQRLLRRLNQVQRRVKLPKLPPETVDLLASARLLVRQTQFDLLPKNQYPWPEIS